MDRLLDSINSPDDLKRLSVIEMKQLSSEVRDLIIEAVSKNRGHLASNLGVVELSIALHYCFDFLKDRLVWDVGHQGYTHKILTGRREQFRTLRQKGGISGFVDREESPYDAFSFGHTGTSISAALGMSCGDKISGRDRRIVAVIGDGALASGMPFEALNHAGELDQNLLIVLNDNEMSISRSVGAVGRYLSKISASASYADIKHEVRELLEVFPPLGRHLEGLLRRIKEGVQVAFTPGGVFVELGFHYYGPVDGHDLEELIDAFEHVKRIKGPVLLHVLTQKGHGFDPARSDPTKFHSSTRFEMQNGAIRWEGAGGLSYSRAFGDALLQLADADPRIVAITAAMPDGTGLSRFAEAFPDRLFDVGICEQHAVGFAGGLAASGMKPVVAIYSTFLQRAYDQLFHDISLQNSPVVFCLDRAGLVGHDGASHHGLYDIAYCRPLPGFVLMAPRDGVELVRMLRLALDSNKPCAIRYPREEVPARPEGTPDATFSIGEGETVLAGQELAIIAYGALVRRALEAAAILKTKSGVTVTVINARFAKPLDTELICKTVGEHRAVIVAEDHALAGGFGCAVLEALAAQGIGASHVELAAVPDKAIKHASREEQLHMLQLDGAGLADRALALLQKHCAG